MRQRAELKIGALKICLKQARLVEVRILKVALPHVGLLQPRFVEVAVLGNYAQKVYAEHVGAYKVALADVCRPERGAAQIALRKVASDERGVLEARLDRLAVIQVAASHVRMVQV